MGLSREQIQALEAPLSTANVKKNPRGFDYVEAWHAIAEANRIFGFDGWDREAVEMRLLGEPRQTGETVRVGYFCKVRVTVRTDTGAIVREGCGYGSGIDRDLGQAHESALKEAESDAMKRALMTFGNPFGLALYDKAKANVEAPPRPAPPAPAARPTLAQRADALEDALKGNAHDPAKLKKAWTLGSGLCAELDAKDPERLVEVTALYERLQETPEEVFA